MKSLSDHGKVRFATRPFSWAAASRLARVLDIPFAAAVVLAGRGFTEPERARRFLACAPEIPDPFLFRDMEAAVAAILRARAKKNRVIVHGDYDADGITATAALVLGLRNLGLEPECYLPSRFKEGYGLSRAAVEEISTGGPGLLITVDCGVNYPDEVALASQRGLEVLVIDHHHPGPRLPRCLLIHEVAGEYPRGQLCGVGLALKVLHALHVTLNAASRHELPEELLPLLDLVAIGTIADLAPVTGENRYYVSEGLKLLGIGSRLGLRALSAVAGCQGSTMDSNTVAFRIAPRLNAAGRLADPWPPLRLLLTDDEAEAERLAQHLHELNGARQDVERQILESAVSALEREAELPPAIVLAEEGWHEGVIGIVAARLVERYHRPAVLLGIRDGVAKGSGRSIAPYNLVEGLDACAEHLTVYGGHPQAVGLTLPAARVDSFRASLLEHVAASLSAEDFLPRFQADVVLRGEDLAVDTATALASLAPFGVGNPRPRVLLVGAELRQGEATRDGSHLRASIAVDGVLTRGIGFGLGNLAEDLRAPQGRLLVGAQFRLDSWQGTLRSELTLERLQRLEELPPTILGEPDWQAWSRARDAESSATDGFPAAKDHDLDRSSRGEMSCPPDWFSSFPVSRDLRGQENSLSALAQVVATGERSLIVVGCLPWWSTHVGQLRLLVEGGGRRLVVMGEGFAEGKGDEIAAADVVIGEWDLLASFPVLCGDREHIVLAAPPFRPSHRADLRRATDTASRLHLYYGRTERQLTEKLLRHTVHPRFGMVCLYRAWQERRALEGGEPTSSAAAREDLLLRSARLAWQEKRLVLAREYLQRAWEILTAAGLGSAEPGKAKLEAHSVAAYRRAEGQYEECLQLCRSA